MPGIVGSVLNGSFLTSCGWPKIEVTPLRYKQITNQLVFCLILQTPVYTIEMYLLAAENLGIGDVQIYTFLSLHFYMGLYAVINNYYRRLIDIRDASEIIMIYLVKSE